jgi:sorbitol/mannitol transport system permease protein
MATTLERPRPTPAETRERQVRRAKAEGRRRRIPLLPALVFVIACTQLPFLVTIIISTFDWNILRPDDTKFVGLSNYVKVFSDQRLRDAVINTVVLTSSVVALSTLLGLALALLLNRRFRLRWLARTLLITPFLIMPIAASLIWKHALYNPTFGLFNGTLNAVWSIWGGDAPQFDYVSGTPMAAVVVSLVWQWTPFMMLILLAGLQSQPGDVMEASRVDGAGTWQTFRFITLPHLRQYIELAILLGAIYVVQTFDAVFTITQGGPGSATTNLPYEIYLTVFRAYEYGEASAAGVVVVAGTIVVATVALRVVSTLLQDEDA